MPGRPPRYSPDFKEQAIKEVIDGKKSVVQVARELDIRSEDARAVGNGIPEEACGPADSG